MKKEKIGKIQKILAPLIAILLVGTCTGISLSGYEAPVYAVEDFQTNVTQEETTTEEAEQVEQVKGKFDLEDGIYQGTGNGFAGTVTVAVEIKDGSIISVDILSYSDDEAFFNRAKGVIDSMISSQSLDVDTVSGATYSSKGIINAVKNALTGEEDTSSTGSSSSGSSSSTPKVKTVKEASAYEDGTYYGEGTGFGGTIKVKVVIKKGKISSIKVVSHSDGSSYMSKASSLIKKMVSKQTTNVDTVSGATYSSAGLIEAVRDALSQAAVSSGSSSKDKASSTTAESEETSITGTVPYKEGIYYGTAEGYLGNITVAVVIQDQTIKAILVTEAEDDEAFFSHAMDVVKNIIKQQNTEVDLVSGATYSSEGLLNAVKNALLEAEKVTNGETATTEISTETLLAAIAEAELLDATGYTDVSWAILQLRLQEAKDACVGLLQETIDKAEANLRGAISSLVPKGSDSTEGESGEDGSTEEGGTTEEVPTTYIDGIYNVSAECMPDADEDFEKYNLSMNVTIQNDKIVAITDVAGDGGSTNDRYIEWAVSGRSTFTGVVTQILNGGTTENIDTVSRATCSSNAIIKACNQALQNALRSVEQ